MKLTNFEIANFCTESRTIIEKNLPLKLAYIVRYNLKNLSATFEAYDEERQKLVKKYATLNEDGEPQVDDKGMVNIENPEEFNKELIELLGIENEVNIKTIPFEILEKADDSRYDILEPKELNILMLFIEDDEECCE